VLRIVGCLGLGLAVLLPPWELYSCCHGGFDFTKYAFGGAGHAPLFLSPRSEVYGARLDFASYTVQVGAPALGTCVLLALSRRRSISRASE
jgi:hypothetical protein